MMKGTSPLWIALLLLLIAHPASSDPGQNQTSVVSAARPPFQPGERLTYDISWSRLINAGTAVMEVAETKQTNGDTAYRLVSTANSGRLLSKFYRVSDRIESVFDITSRASLFYSLDQEHGTRKKKREMTFNSAEGTVTVLSDGRTEKYDVPPGIQDPLSALYYVRMQQNFVVGKSIVVNVHDDDKNWSVEVQVLDREKLQTPLGEVETIKLKTYPKYGGVFQNKGEIYIWLTDDARKIPVLMKSTISIGSIVSTLVAVTMPGEESK